MDRTYAQALAALASRLGDLTDRPTDEPAALAAQARRLQRTCAASLVVGLARVAGQCEYLVAGREQGLDVPGFECPPDELPF